MLQKVVSSSGFDSHVPEDAAQRGFYFWLSALHAAFGFLICHVRGTRRGEESQLLRWSLPTSHAARQDGRGYGGQNAPATTHGPPLPCFVLHPARPDTPNHLAASRCVTVCRCPSCQFHLCTLIPDTNSKIVRASHKCCLYDQDALLAAFFDMF
jgi:hypothetical protein